MAFEELPLAFLVGSHGDRCAAQVQKTSEASDSKRKKPSKVAQEVGQVEHGACHLSMLRSKSTLLGL